MTQFGLEINGQFSSTDSPNFVRKSPCSPIFTMLFDGSIMMIQEVLFQEVPQ